MVTRLRKSRITQRDAKEKKERSHGKPEINKPEKVKMQKNFDIYFVKLQKEDE